MSEHGSVCPCEETEDFRDPMIRKGSAFTVLLLLLGSLLSGAAGEGGPVLATPTDLDCPHERTKTTIYFYDSPAYTSLGPDSHLVYGAASIRTVCLDCGEVLSEETAASAEEIRPHSLKKGVCVLCGYKSQTEETEEMPASEPGEWLIIAEEDNSTQGLLTVTLTDEDLYSLKKESVSVALVRGKTGSAAVALELTGVLPRMEETGSDLQVQIAEREDGSFFAGLYLVSASGREPLQPGDGITLRFYRTSRSSVRISLAPVGSDELTETESIWNEKGYWTVPYLKEGTYFVLQ